MSDNKEKYIDTLFTKLINKAFPEFSNKVTWSLITFGIGLIALPAPIYLIFLNWIIDSYNQNSESKLNTIKIDDITSSSGIGISLIVMGLLYHLVIKSLQVYAEIYSSEKTDKKRDSDVELYEKFMQILPSNSTSIALLLEHDFGNSYHDSSTKDLDNIQHNWGHADQHFHDKEIELKATELTEKINEFCNFLAFSSHYVNHNRMLTMLTDRDRANDMDWLPQTEEKVRKANKDSSEIYKMYCEFVQLCRTKLSI